MHNLLARCGVAHAAAAAATRERRRGLGDPHPPACFLPWCACVRVCVLRPQPGNCSGRTFSAQCDGGGGTHPTICALVTHIPPPFETTTRTGHPKFGRGSGGGGGVAGNRPGARIRIYDKLTHVKETFIFSAKSTHNRTCMHPPRRYTHTHRHRPPQHNNKVFGSIPKQISHDPMRACGAVCVCGMLSARMRMCGYCGRILGAVSLRRRRVIVVCVCAVIAHCRCTRPDRNSENRFFCSLLLLRSSLSCFLFPFNATVLPANTLAPADAKARGFATVVWRNTFVILFK